MRERNSWRSKLESDRQPVPVRSAGTACDTPSPLPPPVCAGDSLRRGARALLRGRAHRRAQRPRRRRAPRLRCPAATASRGGRGGRRRRLGGLAAAAVEARCSACRHALVARAQRRRDARLARGDDRCADNPRGLAASGTAAAAARPEQWPGRPRDPRVAAQRADDPRDHGDDDRAPGPRSSGAPRGGITTVWWGEWWSSHRRRWGQA